MKTLSGNKVSLRSFAWPRLCTYHTSLLVFIREMPPLEELTLCQYFAMSVCKSFCLSSKIDPIYHIIILLYRPHFNFALMIKNRTINNTIDLFTLRKCFMFDIISKVCIILFQKKFDNIINCLSFPQEEMDLH